MKRIEFFTKKIINLINTNFSVLACRVQEVVGVEFNLDLRVDELEKINSVLISQLETLQNVINHK
jgi:hypothetical protein